MPHLVVFALPIAAFAQDVTSANCGQIWADYYNALRAPPPESEDPIFRALDRVSSIGRRPPREVVVATCTAGAPFTSTVDVWNGERYYDRAGNPLIQADCTNVDVVEVQGNRCRRFPTARICQHRNDRQAIEIAVGHSEIVACPG